MNNYLYSGPNRLYLVFSKSYLGFFSNSLSSITFPGEDLSAQLGDTIVVSDTALNNGTFTIVSTNYVDGFNEVVVSGSIADETTNFSLGIEYLIREPLSWKEAQFSIERKTHHGFSIKFPASDVQLKFHDKLANGFTHPVTGESFSKAKEIIDNEVDESGGDANFSLRLEYLFGGTWTALPEIKLDMSTYDNQLNYTILTAKSGTFEETIDNLLKTKVNLYTTEDVNGEAISQLATEDVWYHSKILRKNDNYSIINNTGNIIPIGVSGSYTSQIFYVDSTVYYGRIDFNDIVRQEIDEKISVPIGVGTLPPIENQLYNNLFKERGDLTVSATVWVDIFCYFDGSVEDFDWRFYSSIGDNPTLENSGTAFANSYYANLTGADLEGYNSGFQIRIAASISESQEISANTPFYYWLEIEFSTGDARGIRLANLDFVPLFPDPESTFTIQLDTEGVSSATPSYPIYTTFEKILEVLTGTPGSYVSDFLSAYEYLHLANGNMLKGQTLSELYAPVMNLESSLKSTDAVFNMGWNVEEFTSISTAMFFTASTNSILLGGENYESVIGQTITISGTVSNDGTYTVVSSAFNGNDTEVIVSESVIDELANSAPLPSFSVESVFRIRHEDSAYFYNQSNLILDLTTRDIWGYKETIATEYIYNQASFGYPDLRYDEINTIDEFNTFCEYLLKSRSIKNSYTKVSDWKTQGYDIEFLRRQALNTDSTAFEQDNDIYLIQTFQNVFTAVVSFDSSDDSITFIAADFEKVQKGRKFTISGSGANNGTYSYNEGNFEVVALAYKVFVNENVASTASSVSKTFTMFYKATEANEKFSTISGVISPSTVFNAKLSPARNYMRHAVWLNASQHYKGTDSVVKNTDYKYNGDMVSQLTTADDYYDPSPLSLTQNQDFTLLQSNQFKHWVIPIISEFTVNLTFDELLSLMNACKGQGSVPYGYITHLDWRRREVASWILSVKGKPTDNEYTIRALWWTVDGIEPPEDYWIDGDLAYVVDGDGAFIPWHA